MNRIQKLSTQHGRHVESRMMVAFILSCDTNLFTSPQKTIKESTVRRGLDSYLVIVRLNDPNRD